MPLRLILSASCVLVALAAWADEGDWKTKSVDKWNEDDARQVLAESPWVGLVHPQIVRDLTPDERRESGDLQADPGHGVGLAGIGIFGPARAREAIAKAHAKPDPGTFEVRWESANPVRAAEVKVADQDAPSIDSNYYTIVVYNIPTPKDWSTAKLRGVASLKRENKKDLKPSRVAIVRKAEGRANVIYEFRRSVEITKKDAYVGFAAQIGRLVLWQVFYPQQMEMQGRLEL